MESKAPATESSTVVATGMEDYVRRNPFKPARYAAKRIFVGPRVQITEIAFDAGSELPDHSARTPILVQVTQGEVDFTVGGKVHRLTAGALIYVEAAAPHAVFASQRARITVTFLGG